jgi:hypothetical protein
MLVLMSVQIGVKMLAPTLVVLLLAGTSFRSSQ